MRKTKRYIRTIGHGMLAFAWVAMSGCADDWDAHYDGQPRPEQTLWQEISSVPSWRISQNCFKAGVTTNI